MKSLRNVALLGAVALLGLTGCAGEVVLRGPYPPGPVVYAPAPADPWWFDGSNYYYYDSGASVYFYWEGGRRVYCQRGWFPHQEWRGRGNADFGRGGWRGGHDGRGEGRGGFGGAPFRGHPGGRR